MDVRFFFLGRNSYLNPSPTERKDSFIWSRKQFISAFLPNLCYHWTYDCTLGKFQKEFTKTSFTRESEKSTLFQDPYHLRLHAFRMQHQPGKNTKLNELRMLQQGNYIHHIIYTHCTFRISKHGKCDITRGSYFLRWGFISASN